MSNFDRFDQSNHLNRQVTPHRRVSASDEDEDYRRRANYQQQVSGNQQRQLASFGNDNLEDRMSQEGDDAEEEPPTKIFVGGLSWQTTTESLTQYFSRFGDIKEAMVMKDPESQRSRGFGFVTFESPRTVDTVMEFGKHEIDEKSVDPKIAFPKRGTPKMVTKTKKIFVGGLSSNTVQEDLEHYFGRFGEVEECMLMFDRQTNRHRGFGFVTFVNEDTVDKICDIHFHEINSKRVECKKAQPKEVMMPALQRAIKARAVQFTLGSIPGLPHGMGLNAQLLTAAAAAGNNQPTAYVLPTIPGHLAIPTASLYGNPNNLNNANIQNLQQQAYATYPYSVIYHPQGNIPIIAQSNANSHSPNNPDGLQNNHHQGNQNLQNITLQLQQNQQNHAHHHNHTSQLFPQQQHAHSQLEASHGHHHNQHLAAQAPATIKISFGNEQNQEPSLFHNKPDMHQNY